MSFLSDLFKGNFGALGGDITSQVKQIGGANTLEDLGIGAGILTAGIGGLGLAGLGPAAGLLGGDAAAGGVAAGAADAGAVGADAATAGLDLSSLAAIPGVASGTADTSLNALALGLTPDTGTALGATAAATPTATGALSISPEAAGLEDLAYPYGTAGASSATAGGIPGAAAGNTNIFAGPAVNGAVQGTDTLSAAAPGANAAAPASGGFWSNLTNSLTPSALGSTLGKNALGLGIAAGGLGYDIYAGQKQTAAENSLNTIANQQAQEGATLQNYLNTGTLPPGLMSAVQTATAQSIATAKANMAAQGLSTDPNQNSALASEIQAINAQTPQLIAQIGEGLLGAGQTASGLSSQIYSTLAGIDQTQTAAIGKAIASMSAALSGKTNLSIGGATLSVPTA